MCARPRSESRGFLTGAGRKNNSCPRRGHSSLLGLPVPSSDLSSLDPRFPPGLAPARAPYSLLCVPGLGSRVLPLPSFSLPSSLSLDAGLSLSSPVLGSLFLPRFPQPRFSPPSSALPPGPAITRLLLAFSTRQPHLRPLASRLRLRTPAPAVPPECLRGSVFATAASAGGLLHIRAFRLWTTFPTAPRQLWERTYIAALFWFSSFSSQIRPAPIGNQSLGALALAVWTLELRVWACVSVCGCDEAGFLRGDGAVMGPWRVRDCVWVFLLRCRTF